MTAIDPKLLTKLQAIKTLRDRAGTEGEKDAAQHKLTIIMAKHKLTEQDIDPPKFSSRDRISFSDYAKKTTQNSEREQQRFWDDLNAKFRDAQNAQFKHDVRETRRQRPYQRPPQEDRNPPHSQSFVSYETSRKVQWKGRLLYEIGDALGFAVSKSEVVTPTSEITWTAYMHSRPSPMTDHLFTQPPYPHFEYIEQFHLTLVKDLKRMCVAAKSYDEPSNPNAYDRAFYETATAEIGERLRKSQGRPSNPTYAKSKNENGRKAGRFAGKHTPLDPIIP